MRLGIFFHHILTAAAQTGRPEGEILKAARASGLTCLSCDPPHFAGDPVAFTRRMADEGLVVAACAAWFDLRERYDRDNARAFLDGLARAGIPHLLALPRFPRRESRHKDLAATARGLDTLCRDGLSRGVTVSLEDFDHPDAPNATVEGLQWFLQRAKGLRVTFDTGNFLPAGQDARAALDTLIDKVACVHCKDHALLPLDEGEVAYDYQGRPLYPAPVGKGCVPFGALLGTLKAAGYDGDLLIEHYGSPDMLAYMRVSAACLHDAWASA